MASGSQSISWPVRKPRANVVRGLCGPARRFDGGIDLHQRQPRVIEKGPAGIGQFDAARAADKQLRADFIFEVPDLTAQRRLGRMRRRSAATVTLPSSATARKYRRWRSSMSHPMPARYAGKPTKSFPTTQ